MLAVQERISAKMALVAQVRDAADALMHDNTAKVAALADAERTHKRLQGEAERAQQAAQQRESDIAELALALDLVDRGQGPSSTRTKRCSHNSTLHTTALCVCVYVCMRSLLCVRGQFQLSASRYRLR